MIKHIAAAALMAATSFTATAAEPVSYYVGADTGVTRVNDYSNDNSYGVFAGVKVNQNVALEAGYRELGRFPAYSYGFFKAKQTAISLIGSAPVGAVSVFGRIGFNTIKVETRAGNGNDDGLLLGVGVSYNINKQISARVEYQRPSSDSKNLSVGVSYAF
ncbi:outer membrane beta-barrel protein [Pseudoduganella sp. DS3]|uniref:Outer membrane beta-barrel protein n=1 Tax=Pseudoduganella guangdongensis TaxID=2692179 RepID=A0A6N9HCW9_9BURK|nr:porin [Pseudoduganella guangdongensis]MYN01388.1 outer membrane beta-barrel protein [Pseudoduganella guangdongensis]